MSDQTPNAFIPDYDEVDFLIECNPIELERRLRYALASRDRWRHIADQLAAVVIDGRHVAGCDCSGCRSHAADRREALTRYREAAK